MRNAQSIFLICLLPIFSFGQKEKKNKNEIVSENLIGSWKFEYVLTPQVPNGRPQVKSFDFLFDTIHFFKDHTFLIKSKVYTDGVTRIESGDWEVQSSGKNLIFKNRKVVPAFAPKTPDLALDFKIQNKKSIKLKYPLLVKTINGGIETIEKKPIEMPAFFKKIDQM